MEKFCELNQRCVWFRKSEVVIIDAQTMAPNPVAVVSLPGRVPYGFHALFMTEVL